MPPIQQQKKTMTAITTPIIIPTSIKSNELQYNKMKDNEIRIHPPFISPSLFRVYDIFVYVALYLVQQQLHGFTADI